MSTIIGKQIVAGKLYIAEYKGITESLKAYDYAQEIFKSGNDFENIKKVANYFFENFIIEPKGLTIHNFDYLNDCMEVLKLAIAAAMGNTSYLYSINGGVSNGSNKNK